MLLKFNAMSMSVLRCVALFSIRIDINNIFNFIADQENQAQQTHLTEEMLEDSVNQALAKADYDWDGYISWNEYVYSLGDKEVSHHMKHDYETHEVDHNTTHNDDHH